MSSTRLGRRSSPEKSCPAPRLSSTAWNGPGRRSRPSRPRSAGQAGRLVRFLAGVYNGSEFPFDLTDLRALDTELANACLDYLNYDRLGKREVHHHLSGGDRELRQWFRDYGIEPALRLSARQEEAFAELPEKTGRDRYELLDEAVDDLMDKVPSQVVDTEAVSSALQQCLSEAEIGQLAERLAANTNPGALQLEAVDGLFCALLAAPRLIGPTDYLPAIFGGEPDFRDLGDAQNTMGLLLRYWNAIARDFEHETFHLIHLARLGKPDHDGVQGRAWARGYMCGIRLAQEGWSRILHDEREELLRYVPLVAGKVDPDWPQKPLTEEESNSILTDMLAGAARAYRYFREDRVAYARAAARPEPYERAGPKIGRNDPCPCGSGKKYKRCCGAAGVEDADLH